MISELFALFCLNLQTFLHKNDFWIVIYSSNIYF